MREILFRGKVADEPNEWVYGSLVNDDTIFQRKAHDGSKACDMGMFKVDPETVGQFTGVTDKNGKKIFEGDIVLCFQGKELCSIKPQIFEIKYSVERCGYFLDGIKRIGDDPLTLCIGDIKEMIEVIGNIYDNPELLEKNNEKL